jgi:hypothetical protein
MNKLQGKSKRNTGIKYFESVANFRYLEKSLKIKKLGISGFRRCVNDILTRLGCYAALVGSCLPNLGTACLSHLQGSIKSRLKSGNVCSHSVRNLLSTGFL